MADDDYQRGFDAGYEAAKEELGGGEKLTRADVEKMSYEEINRRWDEVQAVLKEAA